MKGPRKKIKLLMVSKTQRARSVEVTARGLLLRKRDDQGYQYVEVKGNLKVTYLENDLSVLYEKTQMIAPHDFYPLFTVENVT